MRPFSKHQSSPRRFTLVPGGLDVGRDTLALARFLRMMSLVLASSTSLLCAMLCSRGSGVPRDDQGYEKPTKSKESA